MVDLRQCKSFGRQLPTGDRVAPHLARVFAVKRVYGLWVQVVIVSIVTTTRRTAIRTRTTIAAAMEKQILRVEYITAYEAEGFWFRDVRSCIVAAATKSSSRRQRCPASLSDSICPEMNSGHPHVLEPH